MCDIRFKTAIVFAAVMSCSAGIHIPFVRDTGQVRGFANV